jgi:phage terminase large subunit-like protein
MRASRSRCRTGNGGHRAAAIRHALADGRRQYRTALLELPRKNGKSCLGSAIGLYLLLMDAEPGAHVYSCAAERDQARVVFGGAVKMIEASPEIRPRFAVYRDVIEIRLRTRFIACSALTCPRSTGSTRMP